MVDKFLGEVEAQLSERRIAIELSDEARLDWLQDAGNGYVRGTASPHPLYDDFASFPDTHDVGIAELEEAIDRVVGGLEKKNRVIETNLAGPCLTRRVKTEVLTYH